MEWKLKTSLQWDWENLALLRGKEGDSNIGNGSVYNSSGGGGTYSGSELGNGSCAISASIDSSSKAGIKMSEFNFEAVEGFPKNVNKNKELGRVEDTGTSPIVSASNGPCEPLLSLKLGKRTYFEDVSTGTNTKNASSSASMEPSNALVKKSRVSHQSIQSCHCQVDGCNVDLTGAKDYHRKHRVCENHSKCPKVVVNGQDRRFCQQCSRFHDLSEFDQKKRSCRKHLSDHNARRRKPQPDTISFNSSRLSSSFYDNREQMNFLLNRAPFGQVRATPNSTWKGSCGVSLTQTKGSWVKSAKAGGIDGQLHFPIAELSDTVSTLSHDLDKLLPFKGTTAEVLNQGLEASVAASNLDGAPDFRRALSLLSNGSWGSADPCQTNLAQFGDTNQSSAAHPSMQAVNSTSEYWQDDQPMVHQAHVLPFDLHSNGGPFQEFQLLKAPYETSFFDSSQILSKSDGQFMEFKT